MLEIVPVDRPPENLSNRLGRRFFGALMALFGVAVLLLFTRALVTEVMDGTFFGLCICLLMLTFGLLLTRDGFALAADKRIQLKPWL